MSNRRARAIYGALLTLAPRHLRERHRDEMEELFLDALEAARTRGAGAVATVWLQVTADLFIARARDPFRRPRGSGIPRERRTIMLGTDLKYTVRWLARQKFSTSLVVTMLTLGIAANVVVFSLVNGLFLRPFAFPQSERLVYINETAPVWNLEVVGINYPDFHQWRESVKLFDGLAIWDENSYNFADGTATERIDGANVTYDFASVLRIQPILGRMFSADEDRPKAAAVVVIGEGLWRERFNGSRDVLGRTLKLNGVAHTIIGVMPRVAEFPGKVRLWVPLAGDLAQPGQSYGYSGAIGRLKPGVSAADAERDLLRAQQPIWDARDKEHVVSPYAHPLRQEFARDFRAQASTLLVAVAILLIVACANVASVMLARALARRREMGIRLAVGASRTRLARQLFVENLVLSAIGAAIGLALGRWALRILIASAGDQIPSWATFTIDWRVIAFTVIIAAATTLLFGWAPALHAVRGTLRGAMHETGTGTTASPGGRRTLGLLVGAEFALAAVLVVCSGLLLRAYERVQKVDPGFRTDHVLTFAIALPDAAYADRPGEQNGQRMMAFWDRLSERLRSTPGVTHEGLISCPPLTCHWGTFYDVDGRAPLAPGQPNPVTLFRPATPGYFAAMGIRLRTGRFFNDQDGRNDHRAIIVNETFVKTFWPGVTDPVGRRIRNDSRKHDAPWMTVVGMVEDVRHYGLERPMRPGVYIPLRQSPSATMTVVVHTTGDPAAFTATARTAVREIDPDLALYRIGTMEDALKRSLAGRQLYSWLLGVFAAMALTLAFGGAYGVTSYLVSQRTREIGIRVALGARTSDITSAVLRRSLAVIVTGVVLGTAGSVALAGAMHDLLFGVSPHDAAVLIAATALLLLFGTAANWFPARRAARVDPMRSLRTE